MFQFVTDEWKSLPFCPSSPQQSNACQQENLKNSNGTTCREKSYTFIKLTDSQLAHFMSCASNGGL